jgi:type I restriction enzyme S subunit
VTANNKLSQLPNGWIQTTVGEISEKIHYGYTASATSEAVGPKLLRITDIQNDRVDWDKVPYCRIDRTQKQKYLLDDGDIVFARTGATVGKSFLIRGKIPEAVFASYLIRIILSKQVQKEYISNFFKSGNYWLQISRDQLGIGQPNVNSQILSKIKVPLAPFNEQKRIVDKVEELFSFLDVGAESLCKILAQLRRYRQAVLKYAFEGKLTAEWRKTNKEQIEPAQKLLEKVKKELKRITPNKSVEAVVNNESLFQELPETWAWITIGELETFIGSGITPRGGRAVYVQEGIPFIRSQNVYPDGLHIKEIAYVTPKMHDSMKRTKAHPNDVLLNITGASIGRSAVISEKFPEANVNQHVCIIRTGWWLIPAYLSQFLNSSIGQNQIFGTQSGVTRQGLNYDQVRSLKIPLAPLIEQKEIAAKIEALFKATCHVERIMKQNIDQAMYLRQSILKDAFRGKLVPQDPNDEPAEKLLERITSRNTEIISTKNVKIVQEEFCRYVK